MKNIKILLILIIFIFTSAFKKTNNEIKVGMSVDFPPFEYYENGKIVGFDVDLANAIGEKLGKKVVIKDMPFNTLLVALQSGKIDIIISSITSTKERKKSVDFTQGYGGEPQVLVIKSDNKEIKSLEDLVGKKVGTGIGTIADFYVESKKNIENVKFKNSAESYLNLSSGKIDAVVDAGDVGRRFVSVNKNLKILQEFDVEENQKAIAVNKNNPDLLEKLDNILGELKKEGFIDKLCKKYNIELKY